jgi:hypothetical protein
MTEPSAHGSDEKAQITLHIPIALAKELRREYNDQPEGQRGRFSAYVYKYLLAGREVLGHKFVEESLDGEKG